MKNNEMMNKLSKIFFVLVLLHLVLPIKVLAHGEDVSGPNGGHIRMPGAFHTELVTGVTNSFKVFLLDIKWKNPTIKDSEVSAVLKKKNSETKLDCKPTKKYFLCTLPKDFTLNSLNEISIQAKREGMVGGLAVYALPLKFSK